MKDNKTATIITIGDELLNGRRLNTNLNWLSKELLKLNIYTKKAISVGDNIKEIINELNRPPNTDYVFITGGLGPTIDDVTTEAIGGFLNSEEYFDEKYYLKLKEMFIKKSLKLTSSLKKQAIKLRGVKYFNNPVGTAQGFTFKADNTSYFVFPGVPRELECIFLNSVKPNLFKSSNKIASSVIQTFGLTEGHVSEKIKHIIARNQNVRFSFLPSFKKIGIVLVSLDSNQLENAQAEVVEMLDLYVYSCEDKSLEQVVGEILIREKLTLSTCESCTAGKLSNMITRVDGSSGYYLGSIISYSEQIKSKLLDIDIKKIEKYGAVSREIAKDMAVSVSNIMDTDVSISITGISGPKTDKSKKTIGIVFIAIKFLEKVFISEYNLDYDRETHRNISCQIALNNLRLILLNKWDDNIYKFK